MELSWPWEGVERGVSHTSEFFRSSRARASGEIESEILRLAQPEELLKLVDLRVTASGISIKGARIYEFLTATLGGEIRFEALQIPLAVVAVDVWSGRPVVLDEGSVPAGDPTPASSARRCKPHCMDHDGGDD